MLEKAEYLVGETVSGIMRLTHGEHFWDKPVDAKVSLNATGVETAIMMRPVTKTQYDSNRNPIQVQAQEQHSQSNTFYFKSLDSQLSSLGTPSTGGLMRIDKGTKESKFQFVLDQDLYDSYNGIC